MDTKELMRELADRIQRAANVHAVFGEPVGGGANVVIPVARITVRGGGGGGSDGRDKEQGRGMGMGMNIVAAPVGYIRQTPDGATFIPIIDKNRVLLAGMGVAALALWVLKTGLKAVRK